MFEHRKLQVYGKALDLAASIARKLKGIPQDWADLVYQIRRATTSIVLNIAEGASEFQPREKARFYRMALRSSAEVSAGFDLLQRVGVFQTVEDTQDALQEVAAMIAGMIASVNARPARTTRRDSRKR